MWPRRPTPKRGSAAATLVLAWAPFAAVAAPAGAIDCGKADQADERTICAEASLVRDDARMAALYAKAMAVSGMGERGDLEDGQAAWLERRQTCKEDANCIRSVYATRIEQLETVIDAASTRDP